MQISELLLTLRYERYIDDQLELDEVRDICQALIKKENLKRKTGDLGKKSDAEILESALLLVFLLCLSVGV